MVEVGCGCGVGVDSLVDELETHLLGEDLVVETFGVFTYVV